MSATATARGPPSAREMIRSVNAGDAPPSLSYQTNSFSTNAAEMMSASPSLSRSATATSRAPVAEVETMFSVKVGTEGLPSFWYQAILPS